MKRVVLAVAMVALAACGDDGVPKPEPNWVQVSRYEINGVYYGEFELPNGRVIPCLAWSGSSAGGMSCDWAER